MSGVNPSSAARAASASGAPRVAKPLSSREAVSSSRMLGSSSTMRARADGAAVPEGAWGMRES